MEKKITLAFAFRLRNRIKAKIKQLNELICNKPFSVESDLAVLYNNIDNLSLDENIKKVETLMNILKNLNLEIEIVNRANRETLITLETLKSLSAFYENLIEKVRKHKPIIKQWSENRDFVTDIKYSLIVDGDALLDKFKKTRSEISDLEQFLSRANNTLTVNFAFLKETEDLL